MIKLLSLFSGIGAFEKALTNLGIQYELVNYCEIDKYASKSYSAIHGVPESKNLWDVTKVDVLNLPKDIDLLTYGFPCQDISLAGKQKGMFNEDGTLTRSGLFFKALDIIESVKPKIAIAENVKALTSKKFTDEFKIVLDSLEKAGYHNYWQVLNAKDYGIPQNRERVFIVSIRKDIDHYMFEFPKPYSLEKRLKDFLEPYVDKKYYLSDEMQPRFILDDETFVNDEIKPKLVGGIGEKKSNSGTQYYQQDRIYDSKSIAMAHPANLTSGSYYYQVNTQPLRIRKLTPKECFRLMGFSDEDFSKAEQVPTSNAQLYKQAGNSIVVNVLEEILKELFVNEKKN